jgi:ribosomal protein S18 acetylase RimI-like enzyme
LASEVRRAQAADRTAVEACVDAAFRDFIAEIGKPPAPMLADYGALIGRGQVHVLEADGELLGLLVSEAKPDHLFVDVVAVRPERQRQGLGRRLMAFAAGEARRLGLAEVRLYTHEVMTGALALYPALGYHEIARRVEDGYARVYFGKRVAAER